MSRKRTAPTDVTDGGFKSGRAYALEEWDCPDLNRSLSVPNAQV